jgi:hypothetical protein
MTDLDVEVRLSSPARIAPSLELALRHLPSRVVGWRDDAAGRNPATGSVREPVLDRLGRDGIAAAEKGQSGDDAGDDDAGNYLGNIRI